MKYTVDGALCSGHARCQTVAPGVFDLTSPWCRRPYPRSSGGPPGPRFGVNTPLISLLRLLENSILALVNTVNDTMSGGLV
jgi:hypothetical protein